MVRTQSSTSPHVLEILPTGFTNEIYDEPPVNPRTSAVCLGGFNVNDTRRVEAQEKGTLYPKES